MIKYKIDSKSNSIFSRSIRIDGSAADLITESTFLINRVYLALRKKNALAAEMYKDMVIRSVSDGDSPVWKHVISKEWDDAHS